MNKKILIFFFAAALIIAAAVLLLNQLPTARADSDDNVWGWAYSENIGWISFNGINEIGGADYGVHICSTIDLDPLCSGKSEGTFVGYAWSRGTDADVGGVGWISFNENDLSSCPSGTCRAWVDTSDGKVYGWAKALAENDPQSGGWDGWIHLNGSNYQVSIDKSDGKFHGWAWGGDVIGWISFNHLNCDSNNDGISDQVNYAQCPIGEPVSDYKVETSFSFSRPKAEDLHINYHNCCTNVKEACEIEFEWTYKNQGGDLEQKFDFQVATNAGFGNPEVNRTVPSSGSLDYPDGTKNNQIVEVRDSVMSDKIIFRGSSNKKYYWRVKLYDEGGEDSGWVNAPSYFQTEPHAWPWPEFELVPEKPVVEEIASTTNNSKCFNNSQGETTCGSWLWEITDGSGNIVSSGDKEPTVQFLQVGDNTLRLKVTDGLGTCSEEKIISVKLPLPEWIEVGPR